LGNGPVQGLLRKGPIKAFIISNLRYSSNSHRYGTAGRLPPPDRRFTLGSFRVRGFWARLRISRFRFSLDRRRPSPLGCSAYGPLGAFRPRYHRRSRSSTTRCARTRSNASPSANSSAFSALRRSASKSFIRRILPTYVYGGLFRNFIFTPKRPSTGPFAL